MSPRTMQGLVVMARVAQTRRELDHVKPSARVPSRPENPALAWFIITLAGLAMAGALFLNI